MHSMKKEIISAINAITLSEDFANNKVIVLTAAGTIIGEPVSFHLEVDSNPPFVKMIRMFAEHYKKSNSLPLDKRVDGNDGYFLLKNVIINSANGDLELPVLTIFFDQVIGITIGNFDS